MTLCLVTVSAQYCTFSSFWTVNLEWPICSLLCWNVFLLFWLALGDFWTLVEEILLLLRFYCITEILIQKILLAFWLIHYRSCFFFFHSQWVLVLSCVIHDGFFHVFGIHLLLTWNVLFYVSSWIIRVRFFCACFIWLLSKKGPGWKPCVIFPPIFKYTSYSLTSSSHFFFLDIMLQLTFIFFQAFKNIIPCSADISVCPTVHEYCIF